MNVIGVDPGAFFGELYDLGGAPGANARPTGRPAQAGRKESLRRQLRQVEELLGAVVKQLLEKRIITSRDVRASELEAARQLRRESGQASPGEAWKGR